MNSLESKVWSQSERVLLLTPDSGLRTHDSFVEM